jgi:pantothenate kinase type III
VGNTAKLPRIAIARPATESVIGTNTEDQMLIGIYWGYVAMMEGLIARMRHQIGRPPRWWRRAVWRCCSTAIRGCSTLWTPTLRLTGWRFWPSEPRHVNFARNAGAPQ